MPCNDWAGTGRIVIGDSRIEKNISLYANMIVKTAQKKYPKNLLKSKKLVQEEWHAVRSYIDEMKVKL